MSKTYKELYLENHVVLTQTKLRLDALLVLREDRLTESQRIELFNESVLLERMLIIEAAGQDPHEMAHILDGMVLSVEKLASRLGLDSLITQMEAVHVPSDVELDSMSINKTALKKFQKEFTNVAVVVRGLMALADDVGDLSGGEGGKLAEILSTVVATGEAANNTLGQALWKYDKSLGGMRKKDTRLAFSNAVLGILKSKAPGFSKLVDTTALLKGLLASTAKGLVNSLRAFNGSVSQFVDNDFLMKISSQPGGFMGMLKRIGDLVTGMGSAPTLR